MLKSNIQQGKETSKKREEGAQRRGLRGAAVYGDSPAGWRRAMPRSGQNASGNTELHERLWGRGGRGNRVTEGLGRFPLQESLSRGGLSNTQDA